MLFCMSLFLWKPRNAAVDLLTILAVGVAVEVEEPFFLGEFHEEGDVQPEERWQNQHPEIGKEKGDAGEGNGNGGIDWVTHPSIDAAGGKLVGENFIANTGDKYRLDP